MANPNIVNVTSILGETVVGALTTTLTTVLLTNAASSGKVLKVNSVLISNVDGTNSADVTFKLAANELGTSTAVAIASIRRAEASLGLPRGVAANISAMAQSSQ